MANVTVDTGEFAAFFARIKQAAVGDFKKELELFLQGLGAEFLRIVQDEIIRRRVMDTRLLLASFQQGKDDGVWETSDGGMTLEVGTNVEYAGFVNDGGFYNMTESTPGAFRTKNEGKKIPKGTLVRFVPGHWRGDRFIYDPKAKTGMMLKQKWVEGKHYWEAAIRRLEEMFPELLDAKLQQWLDGYFGGL